MSDDADNPATSVDRSRSGGELTAAHDVRNQLAIVLGYIELCLEAEEAGRLPNRAHLEGIMNAATRAANLLRAEGRQSPGR